MRAIDELLRLIDGWRAAKRAASCDDYASHRDGYVVRAAAYALAIRTNIRGIR